jgi:DNA-binding transcriptional MerR regulator
MADERPEIPNKLYFDISEVSALTDVKPYVLRYWEGEFPQLKPAKTAKGQRKYKKKDIETIFEIKELLKKQNYTISGARKKMVKKEVIETKKPDLVELLENTKKELRSIRDLLSQPVKGLKP